MVKGMGSHQGAVMESDTWLTPPFVLEALGKFDLDPCTPFKMPWQTAKHRYTLQDNGLTSEWFGRVWLNPPYGRETPKWLAKMVKHNKGTSLIFARTETKSFFKYVWQEASALLFLEGRLSFWKPDGKEARFNGGAPSVLIAYGLNDANILEACDLNGAFIPLACKGQLIFVAQPSPGITWAALLREVGKRNEGPLSLNVLYALVSGHPKTRNNVNWQAKIRQTIQRCGFTKTNVGEYVLNG